MEQVMHNRDEFYFLRFEHRPLTPKQMDRLQREFVREGKQARAQAVRSMLGALVRSLRSAGNAGYDAIRRGWGAYTVWCERRAAVKELGALDDRTLKDLGLHRSEIESVIYGRGSSEASPANAAAVFFHKPYARPSGKTMRRDRPKDALEDAAGRAEAA